MGIIHTCKCVNKHVSINKWEIFHTTSPEPNASGSFDSKVNQLSSYLCSHTHLVCKLERWVTFARRWQAYSSCNIVAAFSLDITSSRVCLVYCHHHNTTNMTFSNCIWKLCNLQLCNEPCPLNSQSSSKRSNEDLLLGAQLVLEIAFPVQIAPGQSPHVQFSLKNSWRD